MAEYYSAIKKEIVPFATAWMNLENIILSEIYQSEKVPHDFAYVWNLMNQINQQSGDSWIQRTEDSCQRGGG